MTEIGHRRGGRGGVVGREVLFVGTLVAVLLLLTAAPVLADPAVPTNYRSVVNVLDPRPTGVTVEVVGGDAFLSVAAARGNIVEVPGYFGEPYLRIDESGAVWLNTRSPARYINQDRYGITEIPPTADAQAEAEWEQVGDGGRFAWHDHRTHWMSPDLPPTIAGDRSEVVFPWSLDIEINGIETEVRGELLWFPSANPAGPLLVGFLGILPLLAYRKDRVPSVAITATVFGAVSLFVAITQFAATPGFDRGAPVGAVIPAIGVTAAIAALWLRKSTIRSWGAVALSGISLTWWAFTTTSAMTAPVLPSALPVAIERASVALALLVGMGISFIAAFQILRETRHTTS